MQKLSPTSPCVNKWFWVNVAGAVQSVALNMFALIFLRDTCRNLLTIHLAVSRASGNPTMSATKFSVLEHILQIPLGSVSIGIMIFACCLKYFKSWRAVTIVFGILNGIVAITWIVIAGLVGVPRMFY